MIRAPESSSKAANCQQGPWTTKFGLQTRAPYETRSADFPILLASLDLGHDEAMAEAPRVGRGQACPHMLACWGSLVRYPTVNDKHSNSSTSSPGLWGPAASNSQVTDRSRAAGVKSCSGLSPLSPVSSLCFADCFLRTALTRPGSSHTDSIQHPLSLAHAASVPDNPVTEALARQR